MKITVCEVSRILRGRNAIFLPGWQGFLLSHFSFLQHKEMTDNWILLICVIYGATMCHMNTVHMTHCITFRVKPEFRPSSHLGFRLWHLIDLPASLTYRFQGYRDEFIYCFKFVLCFLSGPEFEWTKEQKFDGNRRSVEFRALIFDRNLGSTTLRSGIHSRKSSNMNFT